MKPERFSQKVSKNLVNEPKRPEYKQGTDMNKFEEKPLAELQPNLEKELHKDGDKGSSNSSKTFKTPEKETEIEMPSLGDRISIFLIKTLRLDRIKSYKKIYVAKTLFELSNKQYTNHTLFFHTSNSHSNLTILFLLGRM